MKINRRLMIIIFLSTVVASILVVALYFFLLSLTEAEPVINIYTYDRNIEKGSIIEDSDIIEKQISKSIYVLGIETSKDKIVGKKLIVDVNDGEFIFANKLTDRGRVENEFDDLYIMGIDVTNISNMLGTQLKESETYFITPVLDIDSSLEINKDIEIVIVSLVDSTGNIVSGERPSPIKTVNVGIKEKSDLDLVKRLESYDRVEIIRYPINKKNVITK